MLRILAYSEPWYIQNAGIFRSRAILSTLVYWVSEAYSSPCQASAVERFTKTMQTLFCTFSNKRNRDLSETTRNNIKLVFNILAFSDIIRYIEELSSDIKEHSVACLNPVYWNSWQIQKAGIFRTLPYSETWYIQNPAVYRTLVYLEW